MKRMTAFLLVCAFVAAWGAVGWGKEARVPGEEKSLGENSAYWNGSYFLRNLMNREAVDMAGNRLGVIRDYVIAPDGSVFALLVTDSGKEAAVPFAAVFSPEPRDRVSLNITETQLSSAPEFSWSVFSDSSQRLELYKKFAIMPRWSD